jgi:small subunit ribosomal protein S27Ae
MSKKVAKNEGAPAEEAKKEAVKPQKVEKAKPEKKKKEERGVHALYKIEGEKVTRLRPTCERCGPGYFMANHQDRYTCGHCGFTRYKQVEK